MRGSRYIGFTGLSRAADVSRLSAMVAPVGARLMAGVLVSGHRTLAGRSGGSQRYPNIEAAARIAMGSSPFAWSVVHYNSKLEEPLDSQLGRVLGKVPDALGVQMNIPAPDPDALARFRSLHPDVELILQVSPECIDAGDLSSVDRYVMRYQGIVDHALLDLSCGRGVSVDTAWASSVLTSFGEMWLRVGIRPALAGGLGPHSKGTVASVAVSVGELAKELSWDAETKIRSEDDACMDADKMAAYLTAIVAGIEEARP